MSESKNRARKGASKKKAVKGVPSGEKKRTSGQRPADVGRALRSVYDETLREKVPDELKDLLGRLD